MIWLGFVLALFIFSNCATVSEVARQPASQSDSLEAKVRSERNDFYLAQIPAPFRKRLTLRPHDLASQMDRCRHSDYGKWMNPTTDAAKLPERENFLVQKANRPFYFFEVDDGNGTSHFVGRLEDFHELLCFSTAMNDGLNNELGLPGKNRLEPSFYARVMAQPEINFAILRTLIPAWSAGARDSRTALLFSNHSQSDVYLVKEVLREAFKADFPAPIRTEIFNKFFESKIFRAHSAVFSPFLLTSVLSLTSSHEIFMIANLMLAKAGALLDAQGLLSASVRHTDSSQDYSDFYSRATGALPGDGKSMANIDNKIAMLLELLNSSAMDSSSEGDFLTLWKQKPSVAGRKALVDYALNYEKASLRLSAAVISKVGLDTVEANAKVEELIDQVLTKLYGQKGLPFDSRLHLFEKICDGQVNSLALAKTLIFAGETLAHENAKVEVEISPCVRQAGTRFSASEKGAKSGEILEEYSNYVSSLQDHQLESSLANEILSNPKLDESFLIRVASDTYNLTTPLAGRVLEQILSHPVTSAKTLDQVSAMLELHSANLSIEDRKLLEIIDRSSLATEEIHKRVQTILSGKDDLKW